MSKRTLTVIFNGHPDDQVDKMIAQLVKNGATVREQVASVLLAQAAAPKRVRRFDFSKRRVDGLSLDAAVVKYIGECGGAAQKESLKTHFKKYNYGYSSIYGSMAKLRRQGAIAYSAESKVVSLAPSQH